MKPTNATMAKAFIQRAAEDPSEAWDQIAAWARDEDWRTREVAASALVAIARNHPSEVIANAQQWAVDTDENMRRAACEGLRGLARTSFSTVVPILDVLQADPALYVRKSVANLLRDGSGSSAELVLSTCERWLQNSTPETAWIARNGLKKLETSARAKQLLETLSKPAKKPSATRRSRAMPRSRATARKARRACLAARRGPRRRAA